jgi:hypothetical protein
LPLELLVRSGLPVDYVSPFVESCGGGAGQTLLMLAARRGDERLLGARAEDGGARLGLVPALDDGEENWEFFPKGAEDLSIHSRVLFSIGPKGQLRRVTPKAPG